MWDDEMRRLAKDRPGRLERRHAGKKNDNFGGGICGDGICGDFENLKSREICEISFYWEIILERESVFDKS